jgi:intracellular multiplication protein IcmK
MKKLIVSIIALTSLWGCCVVYAQANDNGADLKQLHRLQRMADEQLKKAREAKARQVQQQPAARPRPVGLPASGAPTLEARLAQQLPPQLNQAQVAQLTQNAPPKQRMPVEPSRKKINRLAFREMLDRLFPLTTDQIVKLRKKYNQTELAKAVTSATPPRPVATSQFVNLSPGARPPVIRLSMGFVTSLVFLDSSGAEWPVESYDLGDPRTFNIQWDRTSNVMMIQALKQYKYGNLGVRLRGLNTPVMITLLPGQQAIDYRVDMRVQGYGPNAQVPQGDLLPPTVHKELLALLDGIPPQDSRELEIVGGPGQGWLRGSTLFLRTRHQVISPGWIATLRSADGMHVYQLAKTPLVLVTQHGKIKRLKIEGL